ncbi:MAG: TonB-dependent receptor plug domain-containing protein, partial [Saprospiraceae bacterium]|nr:TonB-dependent receptor plug domain-containing protein [Saprospiraceae bacterium]
MNLLKEMVVTSSYGTEKSADELVGSMQSLSSTQLQTNQAVESFDKLLDGLATGVLVNASSTPGGPVKIDIRGQGALTQLNNTLIGSSTQPLFIIDGVVVAEEAGFDNIIFNGDGGLAEQFKNPLSKISPDDIESITILKDAAAVGLYGADASNGVVIVKTKRKKQGDSNVSYNFQAGISQPINQIKYLSGPQYYDIKKEIRLNFGDSEEKANSAAGSNTINTDWFALLNRNGQFHKHNLNVGYSFKNWSFRSSFNYLFNKEPQIGNSFNRNSVRLNFGYIAKKLTSQWTIAPTWSKQSAPNILFGFPLPPNIEAIDKEGKYTELGYNGLGNPLAVANENINNTNIFGMLGSWNLSYQILPYLKVSSIAGVDLSDKNKVDFLMEIMKVVDLMALLRKTG